MKYTVTITETAILSRSFKVEASNKDEAQAIAQLEADNAGQGDAIDLQWVDSEASVEEGWDL